MMYFEFITGVGCFTCQSNKQVCDLRQLILAKLTQKTIYYI